MEADTTGRISHKDWPVAPFDVQIPDDQRQLSLRFQEVNKVRLDFDAYYALREASLSMESWIGNFQPCHEQFVRRSHTVMKAFESSNRAYLSLQPYLATTHGILDRVLAEVAFQTFTRLVDVYGIAEFRFEICKEGVPLGEVMNYFF